VAEILTPDDPVVFRRVLEHFARVAPDRECVSDVDGSRWTWADAVAEMEASAAKLEAMIGVVPRLGVMLPNGFDWLRTWWGAARLGIPIVAINTALRGEQLRHLCTDAEVQQVVTVAALADRFKELDLNIECIDPSDVRGVRGTRPTVDPPVHPWDTAVINFTSGTTGPSKGAVTTHRHLAAAAAPKWGLTHEDVVYGHMPLYHTGGMAPAMAGWQVGGRVALRSQFKASTFLDEVRETGSTFVVLVSTMAPVLYLTPERPDDAETPLRNVSMNPMIPDAEGFMKRFGLEYLQVMYGMTELPQATHYGWTDTVDHPRTAGLLNPGFEARIVDENDIPVPTGSVGQLIIRCDEPWTIMYQYLNRPEATAKAWRNGWFHTGDMFSIDEDGFLYFHDRATDSLRRRGENISSYEVEREVLAHPLISKAACVGVTTEHGDHDVKVFVVADGVTLEPADLLTFLVPRLPYYAVPRYVEVVDDLPLTPTGRVRKDVLRQQGNGPETWDREQAGIVLQREA
jgi:crotonobetaine/carnitine-CoA ligase